MPSDEPGDINAGYSECFGIITIIVVVIIIIIIIIITIIIIIIIIIIIMRFSNYALSIKCVASVWHFVRTVSHH